MNATAATDPVAALRAERAAVTAQIDDAVYALTSAAVQGKDTSKHRAAIVAAEARLAGLDAALLRESRITEAVDRHAADVRAATLTEARALRRGEYRRHAAQALAALRTAHALLADLAAERDADEADLAALRGILPRPFDAPPEVPPIWSDPDLDVLAAQITDGASAAATI